MLTIFLSALAIFVFGAFWFTVLFGKEWARLMDFNPAGDELARQNGMTKSLIMNFLSNVIIAGVFYYMIPNIQVDSYMELLRILFIVWLGFSFPIFANAAIWERKSWKLVLINSVQSLISLAIVSAIVYKMHY
ncbi:MAG: hypothetical protein AB198_00345 [Parcubacteria bacterium C7867-003]|nr:MAG: hypothetical protein AB198_00345 [Parcubacteria bacterium C7867-003]